MANVAVWIVLLNWNGADDTLECLSSIAGLNYEPRHVVVVDNGSTDDSVARISARWPQLSILRSRTNVGFASGNNIGIRHALANGAPYVWLLNNDTTVEPTTLTEMVAEAERDSRIGVAGSIQYAAGADRGLQSWGGGNLNRLTRNAVDSIAPGPKDYITAASMLVRREVFDDIGLLDERFFIYWEDVDFCRRATTRGWKLAVASRAVVHHKSGAAMNRGTVGRSLRSDRVHVQSTAIFVAKHSGRLLPAILLVRITGMVVNRLMRRQGRRLPVLFVDFFRGLVVGRRPFAGRAHHRPFVEQSSRVGM